VSDGWPQDRTGLRNMQQLIQLRWIAVVGQVITILVVHFGIGIELPLPAMSAVLGALIAFNLASQLRWWRDGTVSNAALLVALLVDVVTLAVQLHLSGGIANPFVFLFLLQVALGTVLLRPPASWVLALATVLCVVGLIAVPAPVHIDVDPARGFADHYVQGLLICFVLVVSLFVVFIARIARILSDRDARLAELRQRAAEEEHIVRMGLLASGAAHELGTPLSTLSVILGDWHHLPTFASDPELSQDVSEMQAQVRHQHPAVGRRDARRSAGRDAPARPVRRHGRRMADLAQRRPFPLPDEVRREPAHRVRRRPPADGVQRAGQRGRGVA